MGDMDEVDAFGRSLANRKSGYEDSRNSDHAFGNYATNFPNNNRFGGNYNGNESRSDNRRNSDMSKPLLLFRDFKFTMPESMSHEEMVSKYEDYKKKYFDTVGLQYIKDNMTKDYVQDRYSPLRRLEIEEDARGWAISQSKLMLDTFVGTSSDFMAAVRLGPVSRSVLIKDSEEPAFAGKNLPGHEKLTIYISQIPHDCSKNDFVLLIKNVLTSGDDGEERQDYNNIPLGTDYLPRQPLEFDRIIVSQPSWSYAPSKFEKHCWVVMKTEDDARRALQRIRYANFRVYEPENMKDFSRSFIFNFTVKASMHTPHRSFFMGKAFSQADRIKSDTIKAEDLAKLMDDVRHVPVEHGIRALLHNEKISSGFQLVSDKLDLILAYLRRVHFVSYYQGMQYRDEAELLLRSSSISHRSFAVFDVVTESSDSSSSVSNVESNVPASEDDNRIGEESKVKVVKDFGIVDSKIDALFRRYSSKVLTQSDAESNNQVESESRALDFEVEGMELRNRFEQVLSEETSNCMIIESNGRTRCPYANCKKLFKNKDFLVKHMKSRHSDFLRFQLAQLVYPAMEKNYLLESLEYRLMPQIAVERNRFVDLMSVREAIECTKYVESNHRNSSSPREDKDTNITSSTSASSGIGLKRMRDIDAPKEEVVNVNYDAIVVSRKKSKIILKK